MKIKLLALALLAGSSLLPIEFTLTIAKNSALYNHAKKLKGDDQYFRIKSMLERTTYDLDFNTFLDKQKLVVSLPNVKGGTSFTLHMGILASPYFRFEDGKTYLIDCKKNCTQFTSKEVKK